LLTYNLVSAIKGLALEDDERTARMKRFRLLLIHVAGRMNRNNCVMGLRLCHNRPAMARMQKVWEVFDRSSTVFWGFWRISRTDFLKTAFL
jgi:hypothetical protein